MKSPHSPFYRFFADAMLGKLARWLRILGYDTAYEKVIADDVLIQRVLHENRWLLTRDTYLAQRRILRGRHTLIAGDRVHDQLRQLNRELGLCLDPNGQAAYRCADCNALLEPIAKEQAAPLVPPFVAAQYREFIRCPQCGRVYWPGTHWTNLCRELQRLRTA
ncbi:MAG: Mut7-C RNAse domain-containing protein [Nitrospirota bacterium]